MRFNKEKVLAVLSLISCYYQSTQGEWYEQRYFQRKLERIKRQN